MSCITCTPSTPIPFSAQYFYNQQCENTCTTSSGTCCNTANTLYTGPALACSGIEAGDTLDAVIQKLDEQVCSITGDYSTYQFNCLETWCGCTITTEAEFVDNITAYACEIATNLANFTTTAFPLYQEAISSRINDVDVPGITCATASITPTSTLNEILTAYCTQITNIKAAINVSSVNWAQCFTVGSPPSTVIGGFDLLVDQICEVKATASAAAVLPVFNNTAYTCLTSPGATDTLVSTITKILDVLCTAALFDPANIDWACTGSGPADLEAGVQQIVDSVDILLKNNATYSGDFIVAATDGGDPCAGVTISLATPINQDRFVASNATDTSPGPLVDKLTAGPNITVDDTTTPGQIIISSTGDTYKVKANTADTTTDYLDEKVAGDTDGVITITTAYDAGPEKVIFTPSIDTEALMELLFSTIEGSVAWKARFCSLVSTCDPGDTCTAYDVSNAGGPGESATFSYTDCDGIFQSVVLAESESTSICTLGGIVSAAGSLTVVNIGLCSETTTTTTTAAP